jgi:hypothetical protein
LPYQVGAVAIQDARLLPYQVGAVAML